MDQVQRRLSPLPLTLSGSTASSLIFHTEYLS